MQCIILALLFLSGYIPIVTGLQCYSCTSEVNLYCRDPFDTKYITDNDKTNATYDVACMKIKIQADGLTRVVRSATATASDCTGGMNGCKSESQSGMSGFLCCCTTNFCNTAASFRNQGITLLLMMIEIVVVYQYI